MPAISSTDSGSTTSPLQDPDLTDSTFNVTAIVVTFNPDLNVLGQLLQRLKPQLDAIVVVDNGSSCQQEIALLDSDLNYLLLPSNSGLGKAHNLGIEYARARHSSHVLLLDQDSLPDEQMLSRMSESVKQLQALNINFSGLGCRYRLQADPSQASNFVRVAWFRFSRIHCKKQAFVKADFLISSGALIPISTLDQVGLMDESLFIDHIDTEWFMRANHFGYQAYGCCNAFMDHALGERTTRLWFIRSRLVPYHRPFRYYYIFRNSLLLYKRDYMPKKWMLADIVRLIQNFLFFGVLARQRKSNLKMIGKGFLDGIKGVSGRSDGLILKDG